MRIQPKHEKRAACFFSVAHGAQHGAKGQRMVAAHEDRQPIVHCRISSGCEAFGPCNCLFQCVQLLMLLCMERRGRDVAAIGNAMTKIAQGAFHPGCAVGVWPHQAAATALATVQRDTQQDAVLLVRHGGLLSCLNPDNPRICLTASRQTDRFGGVFDKLEVRLSSLSIYVG